MCYSLFQVPQTVLLSVARLLLYADLLGAEAEVKLKKARSHAAA